MITPTDEQVEAAMRKPDHCPTCNCNWLVSTPAAIDGGNGLIRCINCKAVYGPFEPLTAAFSLAAPAGRVEALTELVSAATEAKKFVENIYKLDAIEWGQPDPLYAGLVERLTKAIASALLPPQPETT